MCGINGILRLTPDAPPLDREELRATRDALSSRGPDGEGEWLADDGRIALGHRRLAILDLSDAAAQPMATPDGRYRIVFNGEVYNFRELRRELEGPAGGGHRFRSTGDTEVVLALFARDGVAAFGRLRGMWALAIWDAAEERLTLARDPFGIKPLYYADGSAGGTGRGDGCFRFASQVRALEAGGRLSREVDPAALAGFLLWGSVPEPRTIRRAVRAVPAGTYVSVEGGRVSEPRAYRFEETGDGDEGELDWPEAVEESVRAHLVSDVPVAVFLSAGLDSGTVAALARRHLLEPPVTFTLRFEPLLGGALDEGPLAAEVARVLGTRHVERIVGRDDFRGLWAGALAAMDQPSIDGLNTFLVARAAHEAGLKVVLSGLGGDELLGSYPSFAEVPRTRRLARRAGALPGLGALWPALAPRLAPGRPKLAGLLAHGRSLGGAYFLRRALYLPEELPALLGPELAAEALAACDPVAAAERVAAGAAGRGPWGAVQELETALYLRNQLLRDTDWASMAHSLEVRVPLVDTRLRRSVSAAAWDEARRRGKAVVLRRVAPELPAALFERPKTGFYVPVMDWIAPSRGAGAEPAVRSPRRNLGDESRRLALAVLEELGIELPAPRRPALAAEARPA
jgi:asparagine synthase (glutamine-hydrolysing)